MAQTSKMAKSPPRRQKNATQRAREYLFQEEVEQLRKAIRKHNRHAQRDETLVLLMFRHGLRVSEALGLRWEQINLNKGLLMVKRIKNGLDATHPLRGPEIRALRKLKSRRAGSPYVFTTQRRAPLAVRTVHHIIRQAGVDAGLPFPIHPHMLRHSTGYYLANKGHDTRAIQAYLGHANICNTVIYTQLSPQRFNYFWTD